MVIRASNTKGKYVVVTQGGVAGKGTTDEVVAYFNKKSRAKDFLKKKEKEVPTWVKGFWIERVKDPKKYDWRYTKGVEADWIADFGIWMTKAEKKVKKVLAR